MLCGQVAKSTQNPSKWSSSGQYSSKFVTCVISGNVNGEIDIASYQVSAAAEAMYEADLIEPSMNPSVMRVKSRSDTRYVPDVFTLVLTSTSEPFKKTPNLHFLLSTCW